MAKCKVVLVFPPSLVQKPISYKLVKDFDLSINILRARVTPQEEGKLILELENGSQEKIDQGIAYLRQQGVEVELLSKQIVWNKDECISCGACTAVCKSDALSFDPETALIKYDRDKCIVCELCVDACPMKIIQTSF